jgi:hypothetical protein
MTTFTEIVHQQNQQVGERLGPYIAKIMSKEITGKEAYTFMTAIKFNTLQMLDFFEEIQAKFNTGNMCYEVWVNRFKDLYTGNPFYSLDVFEGVEQALSNLDIFPEQELRDYYVNEVETTFDHITEAIDQLQGFMAIYGSVINDLELD